MSTTAHDDWVKQTLGADPATYKAGALPPAPQDKQSQEFSAQFQASLTAVDASLTYLAAHTDDARRNPVSAKRDMLIPVYQAALAKVDPADEAKGKPALDQALAGVKAIAAMAAAAQKVAEKSFADWTAREPKLEEAAARIEEMEDWGHPKVAPLRAELDAIQTPAQARTFDAASAAVDKLLPAMKPVVEDYTRQKAAQEAYEPARRAIDPRMAATQASTFRTLEEAAAAFPTAASEMDASASGKDFVHAVQLEKALEAKLADFEARLKQLQEDKKTYEDALAAIADKVNDQSERPPPFHQMEALHDDLEAARKQMQDAVEAEDFKAALQHCQELGGKANLVKQLHDEMEAKKAAFEKGDAEVETRVAETSKTSYATLAGAQKEIANQKTQVDQAVEAQDYDTALKRVGALPPMLDAFEQALQVFEAKKQEYEAKIKPIDDFFGTVAQAKHPKLQADDQDLADRHKQMSDAADKEDYVAASGFADSLQKGCEDYKTKLAEIERLKAEFESKWPGDLQKPLDEMKESRTDELAPMQQGVLKLVEELNQVKDTEEYETGITKVDTLRKALQAYNEEDETHVFVIKLNNKTYSRNEKGAGGGSDGGSQRTGQSGDAAVEAARRPARKAPRRSLSERDGQ